MDFFGDFIELSFYILIILSLVLFLFWKLYNNKDGRRILLFIGICLGLILMIFGFYTLGTQL